jgi:hypothetical protein
VLASRRLARRRTQKASVTQRTTRWADAAQWFARLELFDGDALMSFADTPPIAVKR